MVVQMILLLLDKSMRLVGAASPGAPLPGVSNTKELGRVLYTDYFLPFELAAVILLVAIVAAIALTLRGRKEVKSQNVGDQVRVKSGDRLKIISMAAEKEEPPAVVPPSAV